MMKKVILIIAGFMLIYGAMNLNADEIIMPEESIRFRIIANSNSSEDQLIKIKIKEALSKKIISLSNKDINKTRENIKNNLETINKEITKVMKENNYSKKYKVKYGKNYFPEKSYNGVKYKEGYYESLVVEIGNAKGNNFWCLLYPPLCMIDEKQYTKEDYKLFIKEVLNNFKN